MKICIRDDDTNFFTKPEELEVAYDGLWDNIVLTLAVVPFIDKSFFIPLELKNLKKRVVEDYDLLKEIFDVDATMSMEEFEDFHELGFIGKNTALIRYVKDKLADKRISIVQHGVRHKYYLKGSEMINFHTNAESILEGKKYLEKVFETKINIIVPPNNDIDLRMLKELEYCSMNLLTSGGIKHQNIIDKMNICIKKCVYKDYLYRKILLRQKNYSFKLGDVKIFFCETFGMGEDADSFFEKVKAAEAYCDSLCIATHYHELNKYEDYRKRFAYLIDKIRCNIKEVEFVGVDKLFDW